MSARVEELVGEVGARELRAAIGHFATGVGVVTAVGGDGQLYGSTANAISSVSLSPPLVLVCLRDESETLAALLERGRFAISLLRDDQREHAQRFAKRGDDDAWAGVAHRIGIAGAPLLDGAVATLECALHDVADGGDHRIVVGRVLAVEHGDEHVAPLLFYRGGFGALEEPANQPPPAIVASLPSRLGELQLIGVEEGAGATTLLALVGDPRGRTGAPVYVHDACLLGDALGHLGCERAGALRAAIERMRAAGHGVVVYRRDEAAPFGRCCVPASGEPPAPTAALHRALVALRLERAELLLAGTDPQLGLDVARELRWRDGAWTTD